MSQFGGGVGGGPAQPGTALGPNTPGLLQLLEQIRSNKAREQIQMQQIGAEKQIAAGNQSAQRYAADTEYNSFANVEQSRARTAQTGQLLDVAGLVQQEEASKRYLDEDKRQQDQMFKILTGQQRSLNRMFELQRLREARMQKGVDFAVARGLTQDQAQALNDKVNQSAGQILSGFDQAFTRGKQEGQAAFGMAARALATRPDLSDLGTSALQFVQHNMTDVDPYGLDSLAVSLWNPGTPNFSTTVNAVLQARGEAAGRKAMLDVWPRSMAWWTTEEGAANRGQIEDAYRGILALAQPAFDNMALLGQPVPPGDPALRKGDDPNLTRGELIAKRAKELFGMGVDESRLSGQLDVANTLREQAMANPEIAAAMEAYFTGKTGAGDPAADRATMSKLIAAAAGKEMPEDEALDIAEKFGGTHLMDTFVHLPEVLEASGVHLNTRSQLQLLIKRLGQLSGEGGWSSMRAALQGKAGEEQLSEEIMKLLDERLGRFAGEQDKTRAAVEQALEMAHRMSDINQLIDRERGMMDVNSQVEGLRP